MRCFLQIFGTNRDTLIEKTTGIFNYNIRGVGVSLHSRDDGAVSEKQFGLGGTSPLGICGDGLEHTEDGGSAFGLDGGMECAVTRRIRLAGIIAEAGEAACAEAPDARGAVADSPLAGLTHIAHALGTHNYPASLGA